MDHEAPQGRVARPDLLCNLCHQPILSFNYGAKNVERVRKTFRVLLTVCLTYSALIWALATLLCLRRIQRIKKHEKEQTQSQNTEEK